MSFTSATASARAFSANLSEAASSTGNGAHDLSLLAPVPIEPTAGDP
jgi:hypothetical protein